MIATAAPSVVAALRDVLGQLAAVADRLTSSEAADTLVLQRRTAVLQALVAQVAEAEQGRIADAFNARWELAHS